MNVKSAWFIPKVGTIISIIVLIATQTIHHEEAYVVGIFGIILLINVFTGWSPFCGGNCAKK